MSVRLSELVLSSNEAFTRPVRSPAFERIDFLGGCLDLVSFSQVIETVAAGLEAARPVQIVAINVAKQVALRRDPALRQHVLSSDIIIPDGMGIVLGARLLGHHVPERVAGIDVFEALLPLCERRGWRVYLLGATEAVLAAAVAEIRRRHPRLQIAGAHHGYFQADQAAGIVDAINGARADCLFIAMSSPHKERFLSQQGARLAVSLRMGIGGSLDVVCGQCRRAPGWMQQGGLEWLWRVWLEPRRLLWRYLSSNAAYAGLLLRALLAGPPPASAAGAAASKAPASPVDRLRVLQVYGGGLGLKSGISRNLGYLLAASRARADLPQHVLLDPRGVRPVPLGLWAALAPWHLGLALCRAVWLLAGKRIDLVHVRVTAGGSTLRKLPFVLLARLFRKPVVLHLHSGRYPAQYAAWPGWRRAIARASFGAADRVLVLGPRMRAFVADDLGVAAAAIVTLPNAVNGPRAQPARAAGADGCRITFVGALLADKGLPELLDALASPAVRARRWQLALIGEGERDVWSGEAARRGLLDRVRFTGWLSAREVSAELAAGDLFVLPSRVEGLSLAVLEAMAHGCAVVTTEVGEHAEVIEPGVDGLLVPPGDVGALVDALAQLIASPATRDRLGRAARARFERCHTMTAYAERLAQVYREVVSRSSGPALPKLADR